MNDDSPPGVRVALLGVGDLAVRIAVTLRQRMVPSPDIVLVGRNATIEAVAGMVAATAPLRPTGGPFGSVSWARLDLLDASALRLHLERLDADVLVNCAALRSPWAHLTDGREPGAALGRLGFAAQLCAQVPPVLSLMEAVRDLDLDTPVVNCSFPDAVNAMLAASGTVPLCGIGNAGMLHRVLAARFPGADIQVTAHHADVQLLLTSPDRAARDACCHVVVDGVERHWSELTRDLPPLLRTRELNTLTAAHAVDVLEALLSPGLDLSTSVPGPFGLQGGHPCRIRDGRLELRPSLAAATVTERAARRDGIAAIAADGTVHLTPQLQADLPEALGFLGEPMHPGEALDRFRRLDRALAESEVVGVPCVPAAR